MFPLKFDNDVKIVNKISAREFTATHREIISQVLYEDRHLLLSNSQWRSTLLGAGEEKAVFAICDNNNRVFALEVIDQRTYLNGRLVDGIYFYETIAPGVQNIKFSAKSLLGLKFTGLVKAREYVHGYEWARFQLSPIKQSWLDFFLTTWLQSIFASQFNQYRSQFRDVHDRNIMFEIRERQEKGFPLIIKDFLNRFRFVKIGIRPIDVR